METMVRFRMKFFSGISVLLTAQAIGTPVKRLRKVAQTAITMEFLKALKRTFCLKMFKK